MLCAIYNAVRSKFGVLGSIALNLKTIKYFIDSTFRDQVVPIPGSVLYCDLWVLVEHSGIYVGDGEIANIVVDGLASSTVLSSSPQSFTSKSVLGHKIYVSCDRSGVVGDDAVASGANNHVGEKSMYGLVFKNCHQFSTKCVNYANRMVMPVSLSDQIADALLSENWEPTLGTLKSVARDRLGACKWRLWDWDNEIHKNPPPEPDWLALEDHIFHLPLNAESFDAIRAELAATREYEMEISDENIPSHIRARLSSYRLAQDAVMQKYEEVKDFLEKCPEAQFSYADLQACHEEFKALAMLLENNQSVKNLARKMGRAYISEEKRRQSRIPKASKCEVYGTHRSADIQRLLPSELLNLEDVDLETLFYARLLEQSLQTYELSGSTYRNGETTEVSRKRAGPVVACLDTSGSMTGKPLLKAKAMLLAIANILKQEGRTLHVLLFGASGEIREYSMQDAGDTTGLFQFLQQSFGGGTDFETPLRSAFELISRQDAYLKADVLMISDGECELSGECAAFICEEKARLDCSVYSVLCAGNMVGDSFSDEILVL